MDIFVEVETIDKSLKERIREVGFDNSIVISPLIFTCDELENSPLRSSPIVKAIAQDGL